MRMIGALPAVYLLIGVGIWEASRFLKKRFFPARRIEVAIGMASLIGILTLVQGMNTYRTYFQEWAVARGTCDAYQTHWSELARTLNAQPFAEDKVYLIPYNGWESSYQSHYGFQYLYRDITESLVSFKAAPNLAHKIGSPLTAMESVSEVKYVDWRQEPEGGGAAAREHLVILLDNYRRYLNCDAYTGFQIHTYTDFALDRPWTIHEKLEPPKINYDDGIAADGLSLVQAESISPSRQRRLVQERPLWIALQWRVSPGLDIDFSISLRLYKAQGGVVYQEDAVLSNLEGESTRRWSAEEPVDTLHLIEFPTDLPSGDYELRLVVYNKETLEPTVEMGVWKSEAVLAHLRLPGGEQKKSIRIIPLTIAL